MKITKGQIRSWSRLGQRATFFGIAMPEIAREHDDLIMMTADLSQLSNLTRFAEQFPEQFLNVGIAEQNMIGIASGLAMEGYMPYVTTYASFLAVRDLEHVRQHISHLRLNVKLIGTAAGVVAARSGVAHWASEDVTYMRALPDMVVMSAADGLEAYYMAKYSAEQGKPMYIRLNGMPNCPIVYGEEYVFEPEKISVIKYGTDVALIGTGLMVNEAIKTAKLLEEQGVSCTVANMHTIKPIDKESLRELFRCHSLIVTMEEHSIIGGMGSAIAEYKALLPNTPPQMFIGFPDSFSDGGSSQYIWEKFGITAPQVSARVLDALKGTKV